MTKGEIIQFGGDGEAQGFMRELTSPPSLGPPLGEPNFFVQVGQPAFAVVLRLRSKFPRISVRTAAEGDKPPSS